METVVKGLWPNAGFPAVLERWLKELEPDVVFIATGGIPNTEILESGSDLVVASLRESRCPQVKTASP